MKGETKVGERGWQRCTQLAWMVQGILAGKVSSAVRAEMVGLGLGEGQPLA